MRVHPNSVSRTVVKFSLLALMCLAASCLMRPARRLAAQKAPDTYTIPLPPLTSYSDLEWLIGEWTGTTVGKGPHGAVSLSVSYALGKRFILLREQVALPATKTAPSVQEGVMGILSGGASGKAYDLEMYSSTGFITHYRVSAGNGKIDFNPEGGPAPPPGWLFRRSLRHTGPGQCLESVDVAPPGEPFFNYYTANLSQAKPAADSSHSPASEKSKHHKFLFWQRQN